MQTIDTIIIGLGTSGAATCAELAVRGHSVLGLDALHPPHRLGSHHGETRSVRRAYLEGTAYVPMAQRAWELWRRLERDTGQTLLVSTGNLTIGLPEGSAVTGFLASAKACSIAHEGLTAAEVRKRWPQLAVPDGFVAGFEKEAGIVFPETAVRAFLQAAAAAGAQLCFNTPATGWRARGDGVEVHTPHKTYFAGRLLVTAGAHTGRLLGRSGGWLRPRRVPVFWYEPPDPISYGLGTFPVNFWQLPGTHVDTHQGIATEFYSLPARTSRGRVKAAFHSPLEACDPNIPEPAVTAEETEKIQALLSRFLPELPDTPAATEVCRYTTTADGHFLLGPLPDRPRIFAAALAGHGFKFAPVLGEILADLLVGQTPAFDLKRFSFNRFAATGEP